MGDLDDREKLKIVNNFIFHSPPGQTKKVVDSALHAPPWPAPPFTAPPSRCGPTPRPPLPHARAHVGQM